MTFRMLSAILAVFLSLALSAAAQETASPDITAPPAGDARAETGGAQTLADILARQRGEKVDESFRRNAIGNPDDAAGIVNQLGTLGGTSDSEVYRALRYGEANVTVSSHGPADSVLIQDRGMWWLDVRRGPLAIYGGYALLVVLGLLAVFYIARGPIRIEGGRSGETIPRFTAIERFGHWLVAGSFILLALTGLLTLFGRKAIAFLQDPENPAAYDSARALYAATAHYGKWIHNNVAWAFMLGLVLVFVFWALENIPNKYDLKWLLKGGGIFTKGTHPPAKKFNAGQKIIFWAVIVLGASISVSGLSLLFPFQLPMFAATFEHLNSFGIPAMIGMDPLPTQLAPHEEMQFSQLWHAAVSFALMAVIIAHIYLGTVGMEGAFDAMGTGKVDKQWAKEHHNLWVADLEAKAASGAKATPAE